MNDSFDPYYSVFRFKAEIGSLFCGFMESEVLMDPEGKTAGRMFLRRGVCSASEMRFWFQKACKPAAPPEDAVIFLYDELKRPVSAWYLSGVRPAGLKAEEIPDGGGLAVEELQLEFSSLEYRPLKSGLKPGAAERET